MLPPLPVPSIPPAVPLTASLCMVRPPTKKLFAVPGSTPAPISTTANAVTVARDRFVVRIAFPLLDVAVVTHPRGRVPRSSPGGLRLVDYDRVPEVTVMVR